MKTLTQIFRAPILALIFFSAGLSLYAQQEGMRGVGRVNAPAEVEAGRNLLFVVGINDYAHWLVLDNAVHDAETIEEVLSEQYGFTPALPALLNENATRAGILAQLDLLRLELEPEDNLVFFFAGHGCTRTDSVGQRAFQRGFIVPVDGAPLSDHAWSSYISVEEMVNEIALLPARHILLLLDACHSGIALGNDATSFRGNEEGPPMSLMGKVSRRVITSARSDQLASDQGDYPENSLFTGILAEGLRNGTIDDDADGMITTSEVGLFIQRQVRERSGDMQTPDFGAFPLDDRGEMVLFLEATSPSILGNNANALWRNGKVAEFQETFERLRQVDSTSIGFLYLKSLYGLSSGNVEMAIDALEERARYEKEQLPKQYLPVLTLERQRMVAGLKQWKPYLEIPVTGARQWLESNLWLDGAMAEPDLVNEKGKGYYLPVDKPFQFEFTNLNDKPVFIYALFMDQIGTIRDFRLWRDLDLLWMEGLPPGRTAKSMVFKPAETEGFETVQLVVSEARIPDFILSPDINALDEPAVPQGRLLKENFWLVFEE